MASAQHSLLIDNQNEDGNDHEDNIDDSDDDNQDGLTGELRVKVAGVSV